MDMVGLERNFRMGNGSVRQRYVGGAPSTTSSPPTS